MINHKNVQGKGKGVTTMIEDNEQDTVCCLAHFSGSVLKVVGMDTKTRGSDTVWSYQIRTLDPIEFANALDSIVEQSYEDYFSVQECRFKMGVLTYVLVRAASLGCSLSLNNSRILFCGLPVGYLGSMSKAIRCATNEFQIANQQFNDESPSS